MSEGPIKLFSTRAERLPQPDEGQTLREAIEKSIEQVPVAGPITTFIASRFWAPSASRRLEDWLKEFGEDFDRHCEGCKVENLVKDETFISASIQVARIVVGTHQEEKRVYLRNALLNIALGRTKDEVKQQIFLNAIEVFAPPHVHALALIRGTGQNISWAKSGIPIPQRTYGAALGVVVPELKGETSLSGAIFAELRNRGFSSLAGPDLSFPQGGLITNLGLEFLTFVLSPGALPR